MYHLNAQLRAAQAVIFAAVQSGKSIALFMEGVPGSGKTAFAKHLSAARGWDMHRYDCNAESNSSLLYSFDLEGIVKREAAYLKGPLWNAFDSVQPTVMLIDEVDKSPRDFEAFLLRVTDEQSFRSPQGQEIEAAAPVVFVFSSNGRRAMSPEFLRRCLRIKVAYPTGEILRQIVRQELPWGGATPEQVNLLCRVAEAMLGKVEPDQVPSPKEIAHCAASVQFCTNREELEAVFTGFMLKGQTLSEVLPIIKFNPLKAL
jgi:MoxR-like ATPase